MYLFLYETNKDAKFDATADATGHLIGPQTPEILWQQHNVGNCDFWSRDAKANANVSTWPSENLHTRNICISQ